MSAAESKDANNKKKPTELHADDKAIKKQSQWEDKVMGPDSKRAELEKIARARAINEKAEQDKEKQAALGAAAPAPRATAASKKNQKAEVAIPSTAPERNEKDANRPHDVSPKLETAAAQAAPAPVRPADDKFIDKLLREEDAPSKKRSSASDRELESLLAGAKDKPAGHKRADSVDALLKTADKGPAMPAPRAQSGGLPEWAKQPEIATAPAAAPPPVAFKATQKNDGVIHVVQGAAGPSSAPAAVVATRSAPATSRAGRRAAAAKPAVVWADPFAEKKPMAAAQPRKEAASRPSATTDSSWNDPFAEQPGETRKTVRHATPTPPAPASSPKRRDNDARPAGGGSGGWKDPFTSGNSVPTHAPVAMREPTRSESSKWEIAARRPAAHAPIADSHAASGWGVIKKRSR